LRGGEVLELISDLGGGKTNFVRGLANGMGSQDAVRSPSFTLSNQYQAGNLTLYHFDFHRLSQPGIMRNELQEILADKNAVVAVEWPGIIEEVLPAEHLVIHIRPITESSRELTFRCPDSLKYLIPSGA